MTKNDIVNSVAKEIKLTKKQVSEVYDLVFQKVVEGLTTEGKDARIQVKGFGAFVVKESKARTGRNPQTGKPLAIPARLNVKFSQAESLKTSFRI